MVDVFRDCGHRLWKCRRLPKKLIHQHSPTLVADISESAASAWADIRLFGIKVLIGTEAAP
ncbi:hypothetical protein BOSEA31B_11520 [Hyphomicrobiales bacterium]|nr:hypothetical protein BOSEA31B_11520 [Hyphomicrobiales bacterium]CAH1697316.1 hypothetical protein BOSEA1005_10353 [Hyphomicrobiales bacterium]CAI0345502.1 hypothetical protein BO1005MUT1_30017 [Hyphomicrobiales bacterium]